VGDLGFDLSDMHDRCDVSRAEQGVRWHRVA
jgi:hypothetical protein